MKRSEINRALRELEAMCIREHCYLPPFCNFTPDQWKNIGHDYDTGQYAIGFNGDPVETGAAKLKSASIPLNIWHEGNNTAKPDSTVTLKVTIVK